MYMQRHGTESKPKTRARSRKNKNRKGFVGDKSRSWCFKGRVQAQLPGIAMLSLPQLRGHEKLGGQAALEAAPLSAHRWGKLCSAGVQLGTHMGRLPSIAEL